MSIKSQFIDSLETKNIDELRKIPKADLHVHTWASGCRMFIFEKTNRWIEPVRHKLIGLSEISPWADSELGNDFEDYKGYKILVEAAFRQAFNDGIVLINMGKCLPNE